MHWRYAQALANTRRPGAAAARLDHARRAHDWSLALETARAAAADARRLAARADALAFEQAALEALDQLGGDPTDYVAVLLDCEEDAHRLGRRTEQAAVLERLARYASLAGAEDELLFRRARYLESLGRWGEAQPLLEQVAEVGPEPVRHAALLRLAHNRGRAGHFDDAITLARRAYDEAAAAPLRLEACLCLADIGQASEDYALATEWLNTAQPLARAAPERQPRLWELIARNELRRGGYERMLRYAERARAGYAARGDLIGQAGSRMLEGIAHSRLLRFDAAITAIAEAQATFRDAEDARGQAATTLNLAIQRYRLGDMAAARVGFAEARVGFAAINDRQGENVAVINQAIVAIAEQDFDTAERCAHLALAQAEALVQPLRQAMGWACLATTLLCRGDAAGAYAARERSLSLRPPDNNDRASELAHQALACLELGRRDEADALSRAALAQLQTFPHCEHPQRIYAIRALVAYRSGDEAAAYDALNIARRTLARVLSGLPSLADRRRFLDAIPANRFIRAAARGDWLSERPI